MLQAEIEERDQRLIERRLREARMPAEPAGALHQRRRVILPFALHAIEANVR